MIKLLKKAAKYVGLSLFFLAIIVFMWWLLPERTPKIKNSEGKTVSKIDYIELGGTEQCVLIRSHNTENPVMLFLHGGPGMPLMYLAHEFQRPLEEFFTVVQWDRRGAGKTYSRNRPTMESMNTRQLVNDAYDLIDTLRNRFGEQKMILIGHSFGTYLGSIMVSERPELFSNYISIGQVVDDNRAKTLQQEFVREQAVKNGREDIISEMEKSAHSNLEKWLFEFGGELKNNKSFFPLIWSGLNAPEYTLEEAIDLASASSFSSANMKNNILSGTVLNEITEYEIPVYFFVGRSDYATPHELVREYYELVNAPKKDLIYFDDSSHFPFFEEPERFCKEVKRLLSD